MELYAIVITTLSFLFAVLAYFGMHPHRIQLLSISFVRFMQRRPQVIVVVLSILIIINFLVISVIGRVSAVLIGTIGFVSGILIIVLANFIMRLTIDKVTISKDTHLLAVMSSRVHAVGELPDKAKIAITSFGVPAQWLQAALSTYDKSFEPVVVPASDLVLALRKGIVDGVLVRGHPQHVLKEYTKPGLVRFLPWSSQAIEAVTKAFPAATKPSRLRKNTYEGQTEDIQGYAPY